MPQTRSTKIQTMINSDTFNLIPDVATLAESASVIVPVADQAEGDTVATARAAAGFAISDARPLFIFNQQTKKIEYKNASGWNDLSNALGYMGASETRTSVSASIGSTESVVEAIDTCNFVNGRRYRISWDFSYTQTVATDYFNLKIAHCSTADSGSVTTGLTELVDRPHSSHPNAGSGQPGHVAAYFFPTSTSARQIKFTVRRVLGSGTWQMEASKAFFTIEDLGAQIEI